jgi:hypothetical protein
VRPALEIVIHSSSLSERKPPHNIPSYGLELYMMRILTSLPLLAANLLLLASPILSSSPAKDQSFPSSTTVYYWPLDVPAPLPLAQISYNSADSALKSQISSYTPPAPSSAKASDLVRVGLYDPTAKAWRGTVTSASVFSHEQVLVSLHLDGESGEAFHVDISVPAVSTAPKGGEKSDEDTRLLVDLIKARPGPEPKLNSPVILDAEGKVPEKEPEKSFIQK